ncbi:MAG: hypothetical protein ACYTGG_03855 [Planctomycetota bacterium]|jgi:hypothetical protein
MRRALLILLGLVLLAAAANVPIAVSLLRSRTAPRPTTTINVTGAAAASRPWPGPTPHADPWPAPSQWQLEQARGFRRVSVWARDDDDARFQMQVELIGWPVPALRRQQMWWPWNDSSWQTNEAPDPALTLHWPGVLINPLILGGAAWLMLVGPVLLWQIAIRRHRLARGCCPHCGYPAGDTDRCSECGRGRPSVA